MKKFKIESGHIIYKVTIEEALLLGGYGICDECNDATEYGYLVPVLNHYMCPKCFEQWKENCIYYEDDVEFEKRCSRYYERMIGVDEDES